MFYSTLNGKQLIKFRNPFFHNRLAPPTRPMLPVRPQPALCPPHPSASAAVFPNRQSVLRQSTPALAPAARATASCRPRRDQDAPPCATGPRAFGGRCANPWPHLLRLSCPRVPVGCRRRSIPPGPRTRSVLTRPPPRPASPSTRAAQAVQPTAALPGALTRDRP
jgi:hypothetical protein